MRTEPVRSAQQTKQRVYIIPRDCGRRYIGETNRLLEIRIKEHKYNLIQSLLEKSNLGQYAYEEGNKVWWKEVKFLQIEPTTTNKKFKECAYMSLIARPISQACVGISPTRTPNIEAEFIKLQFRPV
jgi:hypothetical protein